MQKNVLNSLNRSINKHSTMLELIVYWLWTVIFMYIELYVHWIHLSRTMNTRIMSMSTFIPYTYTHTHLFTLNFIYRQNKSIAVELWELLHMKMKLSLTHTLSLSLFHRAFHRTIINRTEKKIISGLLVLYEGC